MISVVSMPPLEPFELGEGLNVLSVYSAQILFNLTQLLKGDMEKGSLFDEKGKLCEKVSGQILFIGDVAGEYSFSDWFMKTALTKMLLNFDSEQLKILHDAFEMGYSVFDAIALDRMLPVTVSGEFDPKAILSIYKPTLAVPNPENFYDVLQAVIDTAGALNEKRMLVMVHITEYSTQEQLEYLSKDIKRQNLQVLSLERTDHLFRFGESGIGRSWYIDEDFVQFS
ncbi:type II-A CRISPR-associated protein Csn2 [Alloscardovia macacae]|uniref:Type II-A CRISPR-associated protein Csn2 n=2 Tax=Alloscardovia macacae TaxID=1160091 RepID=A0A261F7H2_9BIFI|nr:type II-A CRISPR-associated protein Csn2 [Alloscardovia macacae]